MSYEIDFSSVSNNAINGRSRVQDSWKQCYSVETIDELATAGLVSTAASNGRSILLSVILYMLLRGSIYD